MIKTLITFTLFFLVSFSSYAIPIGWQYNHLGVPTTEHNPNELYDQQYKYYTWGMELHKKLIKKPE